jgi:hypothetical protein
MSREADRKFIFRKIYDVAAIVEASVNMPSSFMELAWEDPKVLSSLIQYNKISLLHHYIYSMISVNGREDYHHNDDMFEEYADLRDDIEKTLEAHDIVFVPYERYCSTLEPVGEDDLLFRRWFLSHEHAFEQLWNAQTDEVFHLLFANRSFLLRFNQSLAVFLSEGGVELPADFLNDRGRLRRQRTVPVWVKRAIFHRDQGRCVLCQKDLTCLINTDVDLHVDHIVPLNQWGVNDPCNLQLLCARCNSKKSDMRAITATRYVPWWDY